MTGRRNYKSIQFYILKLPGSSKVEYGALRRPPSELFYLTPGVNGTLSHLINEYRTRSYEMRSCDRHPERLGAGWGTGSYSVHLFIVYRLLARYDISFFSLCNANDSAQVSFTVLP